MGGEETQVCGMQAGEQPRLTECVCSEPHSARDISSWAHLLYSDAVDCRGFQGADRTELLHTRGLQARSKTSEAHDADSLALAYSPKLSKLRAIRGNFRLLTMVCGSPALAARTLGS